MSLQVWLPLNGNLDNQGLASVTVAVSGTTAYTTGKIGQGLSGNGSSFWTITGVTLGAEASIACWSKTSTNGKMQWVLTSTASDRLNLYESDIYTLNTGDGNANPFKDGSGNNISCLHDGQWHHFVVTFGSSIAKLYIDGVHRGTAGTFRNPTTTSAKIIRLGGGYGGGHSYDWNGTLNDFRVYDHCLSPFEVKQLSQGLILHYTFSDELVGQTRLWSLAEYTKSASLTTSNTYIYSIPTQTVYLTPGKQYTVAAEIKVDQDNILFYFDSNCTDQNGVYSGNDAAQTVQYNPTVNLIKNKWVPVWITTTIKADAGRPYYHHGFLFRTSSGTLTTNCQIRNIEIYEGAEKLTRGVFTQDKMVLDSSGFNNNSVLNALTTVSSDTPKYKMSTFFGGYNTPKTDLINTSILSSLNNCTISWWAKTTGAATLLFTGQTTSYYIAASNNNTFYHAAIGSPTLYRDGVAGSYKNEPGVWHHYVLTGVDLSTWTALKLNSYSSGWPLNAYISDLRIYATSLSANDIKSLYNNNAYVDASGNVYGQIR